MAADAAVSAGYGSSGERCMAISTVAAVGDVADLLVHAQRPIALRGLVYRRERPVYWCYTCETALAEDEIEYTTKESPSIYVAFEVPDAGKVFPELPAGKTAEAVIWTTTPWTIPGNTATALSPGNEYVLARSGERYLIVARALAARPLRGSPPPHLESPAATRAASPRDARASAGE